MIRKLFVALSLFGLVATLPESADAKRPPKVVAAVKITSDFVEGELKWIGRPAPGYSIRWKTEIIKGEIAICGAVLFGDIQLRGESRSVLRRTYIVLNDTVIMRNMLFFKVAKTESELNTGLANCASTGVKAPKGGYSVRLRWDLGRAKG